MFVYQVGDNWYILQHSRWFLVHLQKAVEGSSRAFSFSVFQFFNEVQSSHQTQREHIFSCRFLASGYPGLKTVRHRGLLLGAEIFRWSVSKKIWEGRPSDHPFRTRFSMGKPSYLGVLDVLETPHFKTNGEEPRPRVRWNSWTRPVTVTRDHPREVIISQ